MLCADKQIFIEYHSFDFYVKDLVKRRVIFHRQSEKGFYKIQGTVKNNRSHTSHAAHIKNGDFSASHASL